MSVYSFTGVSWPSPSNPRCCHVCSHLALRCVSWQYLHSLLCVPVELQWHSGSCRPVSLFLSKHNFLAHEHSESSCHHLGDEGCIVQHQCNKLYGSGKDRSWYHHLQLHSVDHILLQFPPVWWHWRAYDWYKLERERTKLMKWSNSTRVCMLYTSKVYLQQILPQGVQTRATRHWSSSWENCQD